MFVRNPSASLTRWGRASLLSALLGLPLYASCTKSEDTEPYVPAKVGAIQPDPDGALISEADACDRLRSAYADSYDDLGCDFPKPPACPSFIRPGGGSGCFEYYEGSVKACEDAYKDAGTCAGLVPCIASAQRNDALPTCILPDDGSGGAGGSGGADGQGGDSPVGGAPQGGAPTLVDGGTSSTLAGAPGVAGAADVPLGGAGG
jgi:hypothetical protein